MRIEQEEPYAARGYNVRNDTAAPTAKESPLEANLSRLMNRTNSTRVLVDTLAKRLEVVSSHTKETDSEISPPEPHLGNSPLMGGLAEIYSQLGNIEYRLQRLLKGLEV